MFFAKKTKGFCVEFGEQSILVARLSQLTAPAVIEEVKEFPADSTDAVKDWIKASPGRGPTGYIHAHAGVYPAKRLVRRHTLDLKRVKDPAYFPEIYSQQFRIEPDQYTVLALNPIDGSEYDTGKGTQKEALFCGMPTADIDSLQDKLLDSAIYPERLEMGSIALLGALVNYLKFTNAKSPVMLLEMGAESVQSYIVSASGVDISRPIPSGIAAMIPIVKQELGLKDEESANKLFYSNTFDFTSMGAALTKKLLKDLQASIGFYEVQTGQTVGSLFCTQLPKNLGWLTSTIASSLGIQPMKLDLGSWLESRGLSFAEGVKLDPPDERWLGLFALVTSYNDDATVTAAEQKK